MEVELDFEKDGWRYVMCADGRLYLVRPDGRWLKVGVFSEGVFYKEENGNGLHYKTRAFGFPFYLLAILYKYYDLKEIVVSFRGEEYRLNMDDIVENGKLRRDLVIIEEYPDTEKRVFIPIKLFNQSLAERVKVKQRELFK